MSARIPQSHRPTIKVILVGSSGVGKTCLISAFYKQSFDNQTPSTVAPAYSYSDVKNSKGLSVRLQIWDTAGQERFHSVSQLFFRDSDVALVCFEAGDKESFNAVPDWIKNVRDEVPTCEIFFVITKSDTKTKEECEEDKANAEAQFSQYEPKGIFITSARTKEGVNEVFNAAADLYKPKATLANTTNIAKTQEKEKKGCC